MRSHDPDSRKIVEPLWLPATVGTVGTAPRGTEALASVPEC